MLVVCENIMLFIVYAGREMATNTYQNSIVVVRCPIKNAIYHSAILLVHTKHYAESERPSTTNIRLDRHVFRIYVRHHYRSISIWKHRGKRTFPACICNRHTDPAQSVMLRTAIG
ncbi:hypothetical protein TNCV_1773881 [Trichonephila clavipes]|nr:hypothetical protein TNCV_1773881 [Trichonephila clavipes]